MKARRIGIAVAVVLIAALAGAALYAFSMRRTLELGVGYAARVACGCRFIEGRPLAQCRDDFEPGMEPIRLMEDAQARSVTAYVPLVARRTATLDPVLGCLPDPYRGTPLRVHRTGD